VDLLFSQQFQFPSSENRKRDLEAKKRGETAATGKEMLFSY
jgi:hypothetical protein